MATLSEDIKKTAKTKLVRGVSRAVFGRGLIGGAIGKAFEKKFGGKEEDEDTRVSDALKEQSSLQDQINSTVVRIESIVTNIADNVYNIAGVLNAQITSMEEARREQRERLSRQQAAEEEAANEASRVAAPAAAAGTETAGGDKKGVKGILSSILGTVKNTRGLFKGFLKKFAIVAGAAAVAGGVAYAATKMEKDEEEGTTPEQTSQPQDQVAEAPLLSPEEQPASTPVEKPLPTPPGAVPTAAAEPTQQPSVAATTPTASPPAPPSPPQGGSKQDSDEFLTQFSRLTGSLPGGEKATERLQPFLGAMQSGGSISSFITAAQADAAKYPQPQQQPATPAAAPEPQVVSQPQPASTSQSVAQPSTQQPIQQTPAQRINELEENIKSNERRLSQREKGYQQRVEAIRIKYKDQPESLKELVDKEDKGIESYRKMVNDSNQQARAEIQTLKQQDTSQPGVGGTQQPVAPTAVAAAPAPSPAATAQPSMTAALSTPTPAAQPTERPSAESAGAPPSPSPGATLVPPPVTSGTQISSVSRDVAAAAEMPAPKSQLIETSSTAPVQGTAPAMPIPSPIADRGTLDQNTTFDAGM